MKTQSQLIAKSKQLVRYEVTAKCSDREVKAKYLDWMTSQHADELLNVEGCLGCEVVEHSDLVLSADYLFMNRKTLEDYFKNRAPILREKGSQFFSSGEIEFTRNEKTILFRKLK